MEFIQSLYSRYSQSAAEELRPGLKLAPEPAKVEISGNNVDTMHSLLVNRRSRQYPLEGGDPPGVGEVALVALLGSGLCAYLGNSTLLKLSLVSKYIWNLVVPATRRFIWEPAFPLYEDLPRDSKMAFDVFYIPTLSSKQVHRITLSKKHITKTPIYTCFVDGELVYIAEKQSDHTFKCILFDSEKWLFRPSPAATSPIGFTIHGSHILINHDYIGESYYSYAPGRFQVFVNGICTSTGKSFKHHQQSALRAAYALLIFLVILAPLIFFILFVATCIVIPIKKRTASRTPVVKKYWLPPGATRHMTMDRSILSNPIVAEFSELELDEIV